MLAPADRRLLLDVLAPPEGYDARPRGRDHLHARPARAAARSARRDRAALVGAGGGPVDNPFALLTALRRNAGRISLFCHAGATKVPAEPHPAARVPRRLGPSGHAAARAACFTPSAGCCASRPSRRRSAVRYRLLVLSRNLTFDRSWDVALSLDGELLARRRRSSSPTVRWLILRRAPGDGQAAGHDLPTGAGAQSSCLTSRGERVRVVAARGVRRLAFHPIGPRRQAVLAGYADLHRLMVISPFVGAPAIERLGEAGRAEFSVVGRFDELAKLDAATIDELRRGRSCSTTCPRLLDVDETATTAAWPPRPRTARSSRACTPRCSSASAQTRARSTSDRRTRPRLPSAVRSATSSSSSNSTGGAPVTARRLSAHAAAGREPAHAVQTAAPSRRPKIRPRRCSGRWNGPRTSSRPGALRARVEPAGEDRWRTTSARDARPSRSRRPQAPRAPAFSSTPRSRSHLDADPARRFPRPGAPR